MSSSCSIVLPMRILLVAPNDPFSVTSGSEQRTALIYASLRGLGRVDVVVARPSRTAAVHKPDDKRVNAVVTWPERGWHSRGYDPDLGFTRLLSDLLDLRTYDLIVGRYLTSICKLDLQTTIPTIVDLDDVRYRIDPLFRFNPATFAPRAKSASSCASCPPHSRHFQAFSS